MAAYVVLREVGEHIDGNEKAHDTYIVVDIVEAHNAKAACRLVALAANEDMSLRAVTARTWKAGAFNPKVTNEPRVRF